jgi:hypothetical protein
LPRAVPWPKGGSGIFRKSEKSSQAPLLAGAPLRRKALLQGRGEERAFQTEQGTGFKRNASSPILSGYRDEKSRPSQTTREERPASLTV